MENIISLVKTIEVPYIIDHVCVCVKPCSRLPVDCRAECMMQIIHKHESACSDSSFGGRLLCSSETLTKRCPCVPDQFTSNEETWANIADQS